MQYEVSSGAVVFTRKDNEIYFVIVKSLEGFYGFPNGGRRTSLLQAC